MTASTQNQALAALLFLYQEVLKIDIGRLDAVRAREGLHHQPGRPCCSGLFGRSIYSARNRVVLVV